MSDKDLMSKYRGMAAQCWCSTDAEHLVMIPELAEQFAKMLYDNSQNGDYWKAQARIATDKVTEQAQQIAELQAELEQVKDLLHQHECSGDITSSNKSHNEIKADGIQECFEYTTEKNPLAYSCSQAVADVYNIAVEYAQKLRKQSEDKG